MTVTFIGDSLEAVKLFDLHSGDFFTTCPPHSAVKVFEKTGPEVKVYSAWTQSFIGCWACLCFEGKEISIETFTSKKDVYPVCVDKFNFNLEFSA